MEDPEGIDRRRQRGDQYRRRWRGWARADISRYAIHHNICVNDAVACEAAVLADDETGGGDAAIDDELALATRRCGAVVTETDQAAGLDARSAVDEHVADAGGGCADDHAAARCERHRAPGLEREPTAAGIADDRL